MEQWKDIRGYEGLYQVSSLGRVKSLRRKINTGNNGHRYLPEIILKGAVVFGYVNCALQKEGKVKMARVNRLVADAFIPNPNNYPVVNHINGVKDDNRVENLEWCTISYNSKHAFDIGLRKQKRGEDQKQSKLTSIQVEEIKRLKGTMKQCDIAKMFGISDSLVSMIVNGTKWTHLN